MTFFHFLAAELAYMWGMITLPYRAVRVGIGLGFGAGWRYFDEEIMKDSPAMIVVQGWCNRFENWVSKWISIKD